MKRRLHARKQIPDVSIRKVVVVFLLHSSDTCEEAERGWLCVSTRHGQARARRAAHLAAEAPWPQAAAGRAPPCVRVPRRRPLGQGPRRRAYARRHPRALRPRAPAASAPWCGRGALNTHDTRSWTEVRVTLMMMVCVVCSKPTRAAAGKNHTAAPNLHKRECASGREA